MLKLTFNSENWAVSDHLFCLDSQVVINVSSCCHQRTVYFY